MTAPLCASAPSVFTFAPSFTVRAVIRNGNPWFVAADVCAAIGVGNTTDALRRLDEDEQALDSIEGISRGNDQVNIINESGLYSLILGSRKPEAKKFKKWVTSEVLPAIRKTGRYEVAPAPVPVDRYIDITTHPEIRQIVRMMEMRFWFGGSASYAAWAAMRKLGGCRSTAFPESQIPRALQEMKRLENRAAHFFQIKCDFEESGIKWVFGSDTEIFPEKHRPLLVDPAAQKTLSASPSASL